MTSEEAEKIRDEAAAKLGEFFERGNRNWYARQHMAQAFIDRDKSSAIAELIAEKLKEAE